MIKIISIIFSVLAILHGLIHLMGFVAYFPIGTISELPYKTTVLNGQWNLAPNGIRIFSLFWFITAVGFVASGIALLAKWQWGVPVMVISSLLSIILCILDWKVAFRGAIIDLIILVVLLLVLGLRYNPAPFAAFPGQAGKVETIQLPEGLPAPVERYYRELYGNEIPVYHSAVMTGRGTIRFMGITFPARVRFTHVSGVGYRHYMEAMIWSFPLFKVNESYIDGHTLLELPFGTMKDAPFTQEAANQGFWAEMTAYPAYYITNPLARWEPVDQDTAQLFIPYGDKLQTFTIDFDPVTGNLIHLETMRHRDEKSGLLRWWGDLEERNGNMLYKVNWGDETSPWLVVEIEDITFNADLGKYIRQKGE